MKQLYCIGPMQHEVREVPDPVLQDNQILVRLRYMGVCMSEHYGWKTAKPGTKFGHEPMGVVEAVGRNVKDFQVGDRVSGNVEGANMAEFWVVDPAATTVVKVPDNVKDEDAVLEPLGCLVSAVSKVKQFVPGDEVCVIGCGYMGCGAISLLKLRGARVIAVDKRPECLEDAKRFGADEVYLTDEAVKKFGGQMKPGQGWVGGFENVMEWGETEESLNAAISLCKVCGNLYIGAYHTGGMRSVNVAQMNVKALTVINTHGRELDLNRHSAINAMAMLASGQWKYVDVPVKIYPMSQFDLAHKELETKYGKYMKALIDMQKLDGEAYIIK